MTHHQGCVVVGLPQKTPPGTPSRLPCPILSLAFSDLALHTSKTRVGTRSALDIDIFAFDFSLPRLALQNAQVCRKLYGLMLQTTGTTRAFVTRGLLHLQGATMSPHGNVGKQ